MGNAMRDQPGAANPEGARFPSRRSTVLSPRGTVATSQPLASEAGLRVLRDGGTAADAAIAAAAVLNVVEPMSTGIGGDAFALVYLASTGEVLGLNASGRAPAAATPERYRAAGFDAVPERGLWSVTVPGAVDGWAELHRRCGRLPWPRLLEPAIEYAEHGFPVSEIIARDWGRAADLLAADPDAARTYLPGGKPPRTGEVVRQPGLARTFRELASGGRDAFYRGAVAEQLAAFCGARGGLLSAADLAGHTSAWVEPIRTRYRGHDVIELPPNTQGLAVLLALNVLAGDDLGALGCLSADGLHLQIEAVKRALADARRWVADPDLEPAPLEELLSPEYAARRRASIGPRAATAVEPGDLRSTLPSRGDTVYLAAVDADGNAVSFINSLYSPFGSGVVAGDTGICLQNRASGFTLDPRHPNCLAPGKRPFHTLIPGMVLKDGALWMAFGVMGGGMQAQGHVQVLSHLLDHGLTPQEALDAPRFRVLPDGLVGLEEGVGTAVWRELERRGHRLVGGAQLRGQFGGGQIAGVHPGTGVRFGASEPRKDGCALGY